MEKVNEASHTHIHKGNCLTDSPVSSHACGGSISVSATYSHASATQHDHSAHGMDGQYRDKVDKVYMLINTSETSLIQTVFI